MPREPTPPPETSFMMTAPGPANTSRKVPANSAAKRLIYASLSTTLRQGAVSRRGEFPNGFLPGLRRGLYGVPGRTHGWGVAQVKIVQFLYAHPMVEGGCEDVYPLQTSPLKRYTYPYLPWWDFLDDLWSRQRLASLFLEPQLITTCLESKLQRL